jgi:hypothetical protein
MTKAERKAKAKIDYAKAQWFKTRHAELVADGRSPMQAFNEAHRELSVTVIRLTNSLRANH